MTRFRFRRQNPADASTESFDTTTTTTSPPPELTTVVAAASEEWLDWQIAIVVVVAILACLIVSGVIGFCIWYNRKEDKAKVSLNFITW